MVGEACTPRRRSGGISRRTVVQTGLGKKHEILSEK
jgi:hypothetical protein